ncbi:MAG: AAA family ATPase [Bacteroides cellulosilyticus]
MKLLSLKITSDFRNLKGVNLQFDPANDTYVIIGNNGTGKTNILEALSSVFFCSACPFTRFSIQFCFKIQYWGC